MKLFQGHHAIVQYIFLTLFGQGEDGELELKSIEQVSMPVQLRLTHLTQRSGVRACCHISVLLYPLGAACTSLLLCHVQGRKRFFIFSHSQQSNYSI